MLDMSRRMIIVLLMVTVQGLGSQEALFPRSYRDLGSPYLSLSFSPALLLPLAGDGEIYALGGEGRLAGNLRLGSRLRAQAETGYVYAPVRAETFLSILPLGLGLEAGVNLRPRLELAGSLTGGYYLGFLAAGPFNSDTLKGSNPYLAARLGVEAFLRPALSLNLNLAYRDYLGLARFIGLGCGLSYHIPAPASSPLRIEEAEVAELFPSLYRTYERSPPGKALLASQARFPLSDVEVSVYARDYMSRPTCYTLTGGIAPGESREIELRLLFNDRILGILEGGRVPAELAVSYDYGGRRYTTTHALALSLHDRNALLWDDDRKAALFVSEKDPEVLMFAGHAARAVGKSGLRPISARFRMAAGLHSALAALGLSYVVDPRSPYAGVSGQGYTLDFLKFPRQTLRYGAGDCDDLTVLYCALLEAAGIAAAFITVPGHIYAAFDLELACEEAAGLFACAGDLIMLEGRTWLPVEMTVLEEGFLKAWEAGARQWREGGDAARLLPVHAAWEQYPPVSLLEQEARTELPPENEILRRYEAELGRFIRRELAPQVARCRERILATGGSVRARSALAKLYACYGLYGEAERELKEILKREEYVPALINLGNIYYLRKEYRRALEFFRRAQRLAPGQANLLLSLSRTCYELELYEETREYYHAFKSAAPELAGRFAYLVVSDRETRRAGEYISLGEEIVWEE
jgi:tetratricopeptide (TPR) repeat protein